MQSLKSACLCLLLCLAHPSYPGEAEFPQLDEAQIQWLGDRIFANECNRRTTCLTAWNAGEEFPSLGIGHFIWYREGQAAPFKESFPELLRYFQANGVEPPAWIIRGEYEAPWQSRAAFEADFDSDRMRELRHFLRRNIPLQARFIVQRFEQARQIILAEIDLASRKIMEHKFYNVARSSPPLGLYALIDYTHFKGTGTSPSERYQGRGWGLLQVLDRMPQDAGDPLAAFVASARQILEERIQNAPPGRNEERWLQGWLNRLATYVPRTSTDGSSQ